MKKHFLNALSIGLFILFNSLIANAQGYSGGSGTEADPYQIADRDDMYRLYWFPGDWGYHFIQTNNIVFYPSDFMEGGDYYNDGKGFRPLGSSATPFSGSYNGNNKTITGLTINRPQEDNIGLFGVVNSYYEIKNIKLEDVDITGDCNVGGMIGFLSRGEVANCRLTGSIIGVSTVGGLIGQVDEGQNISVSNCHADISVVGNGNFVGGLIGIAQNSVFTCLSTSGTVSGNIYVGGLIGICANSISNSFSTCSTSGNQMVGGFAGANYKNISDCYSLGNVTRNGGSNVSLGGFVGNMSYESTIIHCYSTGSISGTGWNPTDKGFIGEYLAGTLTNNYWDTQSSGQASSVGEGAGLLEGKTTEQMHQQATFQNWNFTNTWGIYSDYNDGYPCLQWQLQPYNPLPANGTIDVALTGTLNWNFPDEIDSYLLLMGETGNMDTLVSAAASGSSGSYNYADLDYYTDYQWQVVLIKGADTINGPIWGFTSGRPNSLTYLSPEDGATNVPLSGTLSWHNSPNAISYRLFLGVAGDLVEVASGVAGPNKSYDFSGLLYNTAYEWQIYELFMWGGVVGQPLDFSTVGNCAENLLPENNAQNVSILATTLQWDDVYGATGYYISISTGGFGGEIVNHELCSGSEYTYSSNWDFGTTYYWSVEPVISGFNPNPCGLTQLQFTTLPPIGDIDSWEDLLALSQHPDYWHLDIQQTADIDASASAFLDDSDDDGDGNKYNDPNDLTSAGTNDGFSPIGNSTIQFTGSYNGNNYVIKGLTINRPTQDKVGMFGRAGFCTLSNIELQNATITGYDETGGIAGFCNESSVSNCRITGTINGYSEVGGMFGSTYNNQISNCLTNTLVTGSGSSVGGLAGYHVYGLITQSGTTGTVNGLRWVGGLVGIAGGNISNCFSTCNVSGQNEVGGLTGKTYVSIINSYSRGNVIRTSGVITNLGSFAGYLVGGNIHKCYSTGSVSGNGWNPTDKGFLGLTNLNSCSYSYWDTESSGQTSSAGQGENQVEGKTTAEMQQQTTFDNWDFTNVWAINPAYNDGYPYLQWQSFNPVDGGSIAEEQTICHGNAPEALTSLSLPTGHLGTLEYKWQYSLTSASEGFENIATSNTVGYAPGILNQTTWYRRLARVQGMPWNENIASNVVKISVTPAILYVTETGGSPVKDGTSWATAYDKTQLQDAINQACGEVWVAAGTYYPTTEAGGSGDRYKTFQMKEGTSLYGSFTGNESSSYDKSQRDFQTNETILSGDIGNIGDMSDNCYHVFYHPNGLGLTSATLIDGFTISDGNANGISDPHYDGGGIYSYNNAPEIKNCIFKNNNASYLGGAYANWFGASHFINCRFTNNTSSNDGAGFFNLPANATLTNCLIDGNNANRYGGGIYNQYASLNLINTTICNNQSGANGGGIYNWTSGESVSIVNSVLWGNSASDSGNEIYNDYDDNGELILNYSCYSNGTSDIEGIITSSNCINSNPLFVNSDSEDFRLLGNSPAINSGNNSYNDAATDIRGKDRIQNTTIDMGAYEWTGGVDPMVILSWNGSLNNNWTETANWTENMLPTQEADVLIPAGLSNYPIIAPGTGATCLALDVASGASLTINPGGSLITYGSITNDGSIQNQLSLSDGEYHIISPPNNNSLAGMFTGDYLLKWNEADESWDYVTAVDEVLVPVKGYFFWGMEKTTAHTFSGTPNTGAQQIDLSASGSGSMQGFNLVGNPYPSALDWSLLDDTYGAVYYWDPASETYLSWNNGSGTGSQYIAPMQGFFVYTDAAATLSLQNSVRTHTGANNFYKADDLNKLSNGLILAASDENYTDELHLRFDENAASGFELPIDAWKLLTQNEGISQIYSMSPDGPLSIDVRPFEAVVPLGFVNSQPGVYRIGLKDADELESVVLEDLKENTFTDLLSGDYAFSWDEPDDENRFILHLSLMDLADMAVAETVSIFAYENRLYLQSLNGQQNGILTVFDLAGHQLLSRKLSLNGTYSTSLQLASGVYLVRFSHENSVSVKKIFIR